ncbi:MAG: hypothetical protein IJM68_08310, partial [Synergistaceae bacterium]|nr:hypothetical protein [Synergistaceae bacterium]
MKLKALAILSAVILLCPQNLQAAEEHYDPQHTVLALNMAVVSIQRILNTNDRAVLEMEYRNIINNLKLGSIEADTEIIALYQELMNTISGKTLSIEAAGKLQANYDQWAEKHITQSVSGASGLIRNVLQDAGKDAAKDGVAGFMKGGITQAASKGLAGLSVAFPPAAIVAVTGAVAVSCVSQ